MEWKKRWMRSGHRARMKLFVLSGPPAFDGLLCFRWLCNSCQDTDGMWSFLAETAHFRESDRTSSTKSFGGGGGIIRMSTKMKHGVPTKNLCYISWVT